MRPKAYIRRRLDYESLDLLTLDYPMNFVSRLHKTPNISPSQRTSSCRLTFNRRSIFYFFAVLTCLLMLQVHASVLISAAQAKADNAADTNELAIPYKKMVLDNGLTLIVHQDTKAPIVAVNVWYHVGSKDEKQGRTGFAHLFEHLMFNGSENYNDDWFKPFDRVGATGMNGTTNQDRTNYYQVVPKNALEMALWMESDRMGHLLGAIDQAKLDEQRDVVKNEKRQGENQPYGRVFSTILESVYPEGHPYSWSVIGSMDDLNAATVDDVHEWFKTKYGAANATVTLSGDVDPDEALALVKKYFGHIDAGPPLLRQARWIAKRSGKQEQIMYDRVPQARLYKIWNIPEWGSDEAMLLSLASGVLSSDKRSRLYNRLVFNEQKASDISAFSFNSEIGGLFGVVATALNEDDLDYIDQAIDEELERFMQKGPNKQELERVRNAARASALRGLESAASKADTLAEHQVYSGDPNSFLKQFETFNNATAKEVMNTTREWLSDGEYALRVLPFKDYTVSESKVDRSAGIPEIGAPPIVQFDRLQRAKLNNGLDIILAERPSVPVVRMQMVFDAGYAADQGVKAGTANLTMAMLDEGTDKYNALEISSELAQMGTRLGAEANLDSSRISLNTLKENLDASLAIYSDVILNPSFPSDQLERLRKQQLAAIAQEKNSPFGAALRLMPTLLYGEDHAYAAPFSGSGSEASVTAIQVDDLKRYHEAWFTAPNGTLVVTGNISMDELKPLAEKHFANLSNKAAPDKNISDIESLEKSKVYLLDRPGSDQSAIIATKMLPKYGFDGELALQLMNEVLGASFNSRINLNLREDKGWSYGARSIIRGTASQRPFITYAPVQTDKTAESMAEIHKELSEIASSRPASESELGRSLDKRTLTLPGRWESSGAIESDILTLVRYDLDESYWDKYVSELRGIGLEQVNQSAKDHMRPDQMLWVVVGDREKIEQEIRKANLGELFIVDVDGKPVTE